MLNNILPGEEIIELEKASGHVCLTIIVPTHRLSPERRVDKLTLRRAVDQAIDQLFYKYDDELMKRALSASLKKLYEEADLLHNYDGLGLYVSTGLKHIARFSFPVTGKIVISDQFDLRDLWYQTQLNSTYYILMLTEKKVTFWEAHSDSLEEVKDSDIPDAYHEEYLYEYPSRSSSYAGYAHVKGFEKDKGFIENERSKAFYKKIDHAIRKYIIGEQPMILIAPEKAISLYKDVSKLLPNIVGVVKGNYAHSDKQKLASIVWPMMYDYYRKRFETNLKEAKELAGKHRAVFGIEACWRAASDGNAYQLLVEKDFRMPGFVIKNGRQLYLKPPSVPHISLPDAVHELMLLVRAKNGKIIFGENNTLINEGHIALITRY